MRVWKQFHSNTGLHTWRFGLSLLAFGYLSPLAIAQDAPSTILEGSKKYSPYQDENFPNQIFFGDTHLHTSYSADAGMIGNTLGPDQAYRFAKGEVVASSTGVRARLARPLDFLVVADHAENIGVIDYINRGDPLLLDTSRPAPGALPPEPPLREAFWKGDRKVN